MLYVFIINYCLEVEIPQIDGAANIENFMSQLIFLCKIIGTHEICGILCVCVKCKAMALLRYDQIGISCISMLPLAH